MIGIDNHSRFKIDKVAALNCQTDTSFEWSPRKRIIKVNRLKFFENPTVQLQLNGRLHLLTFSDHDFHNLNDSIVSIWIKDTTVIRGIPPFNELAEFSIILQAGLHNLHLEPMSINAPALTTVKTWPDSTGKELIFDFNWLKKKPYFIVRFNGKRFKVKLLKSDLSEQYYGRRYFWITENGILPQN